MNMRLILILAAAAILSAQTPAVLGPDAAGVFPIWPAAAPGSENWTWKEQPGVRNGARMIRNVSMPTLTMYKPEAGKANGASLIIAPGGAFRFLMVDYEGVDVARWAVRRGITAFVLRYRVMHTPEDETEMTAYLQQLTRMLTRVNVRAETPPPYDAATLAAIAMGEQDGRQAIRYVRRHAAEWSLDPHRIGIIGFSAGGGVVMGPVMQHDAESRPDFAAPIYAAYRAATPVPDDAPPLFIAIADDDRMIPPNSAARLYMAWHAAGKTAEFHSFRTGDHGFGMKTLGRSSDQWTTLFDAWLQSIGVVKPTTSRMFVFGDSYSDMGAGYVDGDGPTAVGYLANRLGFQLTTPSAPGANAGSINFAVSGAQTGRGAGRKVQGALLGYGMANQVDDFAARVESKAITFDPARTLFYLAGGLNDRRLPSAETVANMEGHIRKLYAMGARNFRIAVLPVAIPAFREVSERLNPELARIPSELRAVLPEATIETSGWGRFFDEVMRNPAAYGIENVKDACAGRAIFGESDAPCAKPSAYYYYHAAHPSTAVHRIAGDKLYDEIVKP